MSMNSRSSFREKLKKIIKDSPFTSSEIARFCGVKSSSSVNNWANRGRIKDEYLEKLCEMHKIDFLCFKFGPERVRESKLKQGSCDEKYYSSLRKIRASERHYRIASDSQGIGLIAIDLLLDDVFCYQNLEKILGIKRGSLNGKLGKLFKHIPFTHTEQIKKLIEDAKSNVISKEPFELVINIQKKKKFFTCTPGFSYDFYDNPEELILVLQPHTW